MLFCLKSSLLLWPAGMALWAGAAFAATLSTQTPLIRSVVKLDENGRLVRRVIVTPVSSKLDLSEPSESQKANVNGVTELVEAAAKRYDVDPLLVHSVIEVESN